MKVTCPQCAASFNVDASKIPAKGARLRCAKCSELFLVRPLNDEESQPTAGPAHLPFSAPLKDDERLTLSSDPMTDGESSTSQKRLVPPDLRGGDLSLGDVFVDAGNETSHAPVPLSRSFTPVPLPDMDASLEGNPFFEDDTGEDDEGLFDPFDAKEFSGSGPLPLPEPTHTRPNAAIPLPARTRSKEAIPLPDNEPDHAAQQQDLSDPFAWDDDAPAASQKRFVTSTPVPLPSESALGEEELFGSNAPAPISTIFEKEQRDASSPAMDETKAAFDPKPLSLDEAFDTSTTSAEENLWEGSSSSSAQAPEPFGEMLDAEGEETDSVAEDFLKSLSNSVMKGAASSLSFLGKDESETHDAVVSDSPSDIMAEEEHSSREPSLGVFEHESKTADPVLGRRDADERSSTSDAPDIPKSEDNDFESLLTFNNSHDETHESEKPTASTSGFERAAFPAKGGSDAHLEVLDFIEEKGSADTRVTAIQANVSMYYIRRNAENPRGPFDTLTIIYMITSGQLLGDEKVSIDQEAWSPINSVRAFAEAIEQLMESPGDVSFAVNNVAAGFTNERNDAIERVKARYGDRISDIAIVSRPDEEKRRLPAWGIAAIAVLLAALGGASLGLTSYGPFGVHWLFPKEIKKGTPEYRQFVQSSEALLAGTWVDIRRALTLTEALLSKDPSLIEPRALYAQSAFHLQRVYRTDLDKKEKAERYLKEISTDKEKKKNNPELLKAQIAFDLLKKNTSKRTALEAHLRATPSDREATFLLGDLLAIAGDLPGAIQTMESLLEDNPDDARALHQLGRLKLEDRLPVDTWVDVELPDAEEMPEKSSEEAPSENVPAESPSGEQRTPSTVDEEADSMAEPRSRIVKVDPNVLQALAFFKKAFEADPRRAESLLEEADILTHLIPKRLEALATLERIDADGLRERLSSPDQSRVDFLRGLNLVALRQYAEAFASFEKAMEMAPGNAEIPALYGRLVLRQGNCEKAESLFAKARTAEPQNILHLDGQVRSLICLEKYHQAQNLLKEGLTSHPENTRLALLQGRVFDELDKLDEAAMSYQKAVMDTDVGWEASSYLGNIYLRRARFEEAKEAFDSALALSSEHALPHVGLGRYFLGVADLDAAFDAFEKALQIDVENAPAHFGMADVLFAQKQFTEARKAFEQAIVLDGRLPQLQARYASLLWLLGEREAAAEAFEKARVLDFKDIESLWKLGAVYFELEKYDQALDILGNALAAEPGQVNALFYKARVHHARQESTQAIQAIRTALERKKDRAELHFWAGEIYSQAQKFSEAMAAWTEAIHLDPNYADAMEALARTHHEQGDFSRAVEFFEKTIQADPKRRALVFKIAECLFSMNKYKAAIQKYEAMIAFDSNFKEAYFKIGRSYNELNQLDQAIYWYNKATSLDPAYSEAWMLLGYAYKEKFRYRQAIKAFEEYLKTATNTKDIQTISTEIGDLNSLL